MVRIDRLMGDIDAMARIGALPDGGVQRPAMSRADIEGRAYLLKRMREAGLRTWIDAAGNVFGRREADTAAGVLSKAGNTPAVVMGSHIDTIEHGGRFDGVLGVLGALECVRALNDSGRTVDRPIEVVAFNDEEERFIGFLGSYAFVGAMRPDQLEGVVDHNGTSLTETMRSVELKPKEIHRAERDPESVTAFLELHIEQGPLLEQAGVSIGVVNKVKGDYRWRITIEGRTDHAGAPRTGRRDAFMTMHAIVSEMNHFCDHQGGSDTTLTVGRVTVSPNIETAQPGFVEFSLDLRSPSLTFLKEAELKLHHVTEELAARNGPGINSVPILLEEPVDFDETILETIREASRSSGYRYLDLYSGAGHDAQVIARRFPSAMIFVPSAGGRSHCPEEFTTTADIEKGVNVLFGTMIRLVTEIQ